MKAEAYLKLHRHQEADETWNNCPKFDDDECTKFFGPIGNAGLLVVRAQVDMAAGRLVFLQQKMTKSMISGFEKFSSFGYKRKYNSGKYWHVFYFKFSYDFRTAQKEKLCWQ